MAYLANIKYVFEIRFIPKNERPDMTIQNYLTLSMVINPSYDTLVHRTNLSNWKQVIQLTWNGRNPSTKTT